MHCRQNTQLRESPANPTEAAPPAQPPSNVLLPHISSGSPPVPLGSSHHLLPQQQHRKLLWLARAQRRPSLIGWSASGGCHLAPSQLQPVATGSRRIRVASLTAHSVFEVSSFMERTRFTLKYALPSSVSLSRDPLAVEKQVDVSLQKQLWKSGSMRGPQLSGTSKGSSWAFLLLSYLRLEGGFVIITWIMWKVHFFQQNVVSNQISSVLTVSKSH